MPLQVITIYAAGTGGTQSAIAQIDIPGDGMITGVDWAVQADLDADNEEFQAGVSFASSEDIHANDVRSLVSSVAAYHELATSGTSVTNLNKFVSFDPGIPVFAGERMYLHVVATSGVASKVTAHLHLDTSGAVVGAMRAASRRR